jgi:adenylate kinase family enzyme
VTTAHVVTEKRDTTVGEKKAAGANPYLQSLLPALHRLDQLLEWAVVVMQSSGRDTATPFRGLYIDEDEVRRLLAQAPAATPFGGQRPAMESDGVCGSDAPLTKLIQSFGLSSFDIDLVILAVAPELDLRYERLYAFLQDDITRKRPTIELALNLLCSGTEEKLERRSHFDPEAPLVRHRLVQILADPNQVSPPLLGHYFKLDSQVLRFLLGDSGLDPHLFAYCEFAGPEQDWGGVPNADELRAVLPLLGGSDTAQPMRLYFQGAPDSGKSRAARALAGAAGRTLLTCDLGRILDGNDFEQRLHGVFREAALRESLLYISGANDLRGESRAPQRETLLRKLATYCGPVILGGSQPWIPGGASFAVLTVVFGVLDFEARRACWQSQLARYGLCVDEKQLEALAGRFRLTAAQIEAAVRGAQLSAQWRTAKSQHPDVPTLDDLYAMARGECGHQLASLARRIEPRHVWNDIVLPPDQVSQLREICFQAEYRHVVYDGWGFDQKLSLGKGLNVLFFGAPGTGKTMAAEVIAHELRLDLYRIDLSQVISKYIGETEKNLDRIFSAAENSNAILFFDEADALFGKRSEVRDSHDRYANIEISYLLQKMEEYQGISILATNLRQNLDEAFVRRLQIIVEFPFPDEEYRQRIWKLAFPREAPLADDVHFDRLAREVRLAGGNIKNMALAAAFLAAADGQTIRMSHLVQAARREHQKLGRSWNDGAFREPAGRVQ